MAVKRFNTRIINKTDSISNLTPQSGAIVPLKGEIVIGTTGSSNTSSQPYKVKVGDGTHTWSQLPLLSPHTLTGSALTANNPAGADNETINVSIPADTRLYGRYVFSDSSDDTEFTVAVTGSNILRTDHYILLDNSGSSYDRLFNGITVQGIDSANISLQREWVSAYDVTELKISVYEINGTAYATVTSKSGITNGGNL